MTGPRARYWDRQARTYDARMARLEQGHLAEPRRWVCERAHGATLEIGVGTGANLGHYGPGVALTAVDVSARMLEQARRAATRLGATVDLRQADAMALPFDDAAFDCVVAAFVMCAVPDERAALAEAVRVLRPGGDLLLVDHVAAQAWPLRALQHVVDVVTVPLQGERYTRRPATVLRAAGTVEVLATRSSALGGMIERVHARRRA